ncbi:uncharacterized protein LOC134753355 [Cydia strobilella]|uniref:uncharacterized protein LOC134753355 n=1 Tax=Cydia strobilella TaxID=1100964 RepID=UPI0030068D12
MSCDSDCCFAGDPDNVPGYERLVATTQMDHDYVNNTNDMAELVPINNPRDKIDCTNTNKLNVIKKTKLNRQLYQAIKFALESRPSISDFDIAQYEPESESDFDHDFESHHDLNSPHHDLKSPHHTSAHHNSKSPHLDSKSSHHDSKSPYLDSKSSHQDIKSPHHDSKSSLHDSESSPQYEKSLHDSASPHRYSKSSHLETNSLHHDSKSPHHDSKSSSYPDSESTLTCESDYEDAENFPNIMLAKAFSGVAEGSGVSVDVQKKAHLVLNPPSEWPCTVESCFCTRQHSEDSSDCSVIQISDEDTRSNVKRGGKRSRKECKLCEKTFVSLHALWEHYESEHVDICRKGCCNGTALKYGNNRRLLKVPDVPDPQKSQYNCAECGIDCRNKTQMRLHVATLKHKLRSLWRFQCDTCKRKFLNKVQVAEHIERDHLAKEACPKCGATFHSERALRKHAAAHALAHKQAHAHANTHAHTQAQGARKRRTRKLTETEKTPISRNVLDTDTTATIALSNRRKKRKRKGTHWTRQRKQLARNSDTQTNVQRTRKRTQGTQPRKQRATDSGTHTNVQGTQEQTQGTQSRVQLAPNSDAHMNAQWVRKRTQGTQPRKQLATDLGTHTNVQGTQEQTQGTVQLAPNSDTQMQMQLVWIRKRTRGTRKRTQGKRKRTQGTQEQTQGTQSRVQLAPNSDTHTNGMQGPRKRTQTVGELRKMQMGKERTQLENERMVNFYLNKFTCFEAGGEISRALTYPPKNQCSPS